MDLQKMVDELNDLGRQERANSQMTIGSLLDRLEALDPNLTIEGIGNPHSYRGYYSDLALEELPVKVTARYLSETLEELLGEELEGYKGGNFLMEENTPVWVSSYGSCGQKLMEVNEDGSIVLEEE